MTRRSALAAIAALVVATAAVGVPAAVAAPRAVQSEAPGLGLRLVEAPESRRDDPRAATTVVDHVAPGAMFTRRLEATNGGDEPMAVRFYVRPAQVRDGTLAIDETGTGLVSEAVTIEPAGGTIPPGGSLAATARFAVPRDAPAGEHYGVLLVERPAAPGSGLQVATRSGVAVYLSVGPGGEPASDFEIATLTASRDEQGAPNVVASVRNTGGRALSITGDLRLSEGPGGLAAGPFGVELGTVLGVGQTAPVRVALDQRLPDGPWRAALTLRSGRVERAAEAMITFPAGTGLTAEPVPAKELSLAEDPDVVVPIAAGLVGLLALLLLVTGLITSRRRARARAAADARRPVPR